MLKTYFQFLLTWQNCQSNQEVFIFLRRGIQQATYRKTLLFIILSKRYITVHRAEIAWSRSIQDFPSYNYLTKESNFTNDFETRACNSSISRFGDDLFYSLETEHASCVVVGKDDDLGYSVTAS